MNSGHIDEYTHWTPFNTAKPSSKLCCILKTPCTTFTTTCWRLKGNTETKNSSLKTAKGKQHLQHPSDHLVVMNKIGLRAHVLLFTSVQSFILSLVRHLCIIVFSGFAVPGAAVTVAAGKIIRKVNRCGILDLVLVTSPHAVSTQRSECQGGKPAKLRARKAGLIIHFLSQGKEVLTSHNLICFILTSTWYLYNYYLWVEKDSFSTLQWRDEKNRDTNMMMY